MLNETLETLISVLEQRVQLNRRLLDLCDHKRTMLAALDLEGLQSVMQTEQALIAQLVTLEDACYDLVVRIIGPEVRPRRLGKDVLLRRVIALAPEPDRSRLDLLRSDLLQVLAELRDSHTVNQVVSRQSLNRFRDSLHLSVPVSNSPRPLFNRPLIDHAV